MIDLIDAQVSEGLTIDYKADCNRTADGSGFDFFGLHKDIASFANSSGGDLVVGMKEGKGEESGLPKELVGIQGQSAESIKLKLQQSADSAIEPRVEFSMKDIPLERGGFALIIRIKRSLFKPHGVLKDHRYCFAQRNNSGNVNMDIRQIRDAFIGADSIVKEIRSFISQRVEAIERSGANTVLAEKDVPYFKFSPNAKYAIHLIPLNVIDNPEPISLQSFKDDSGVYRKLAAWGYNFRYNLDGIFTSNEKGTYPHNYGYTYMQAYRNGIFECVDSQLLGQERYISTPQFEKQLTETIHNLLDVADIVGVSPPVMLSISFYNMKNRLLDTGSFDRSTILLPELILDDLDIDANPAKALKPILDMFHQAAGNDKSPLGN
ncbi:hypothetical protein CCAX7_26070 [Capsulimonas corticalis]|uniref:Uncharacterized protein n=1 Tax=Capsulimonas corticalis TaxID=2219043 RepID=A0A402CVW7_9BACT|nr:ATP-binding protein [Capsulimonas corticalis]BDI30556.1 hypothetical protein CCAX7_26070 [Capsulimonas corticalis]